jgi:hypothetical protein
MPDTHSTPSAPALERCPRCRSTLVQPVSWRRVADDRWELLLRCPDCGDRWHDEASTAAVRRLHEVMKEGREVLERHLDAIERIAWQETAEAFIQALAAGAILPEDFGRP